MASTIAAITTGTGGVVTTADSSGNLSLLSGATTVVAVTSAGVAVTGTLAATGAVSGTTGTFTGAVSGTTGTFTGVSTFPAGTALLPAITTTGDTNTGLWFPAADTVAASTGGTERMRIDSSGNVGIGTASPAAPLDVTRTAISANTPAMIINSYTTTSVPNATATTVYALPSSGHIRYFQVFIGTGSGTADTTNYAAYAIIAADSTARLMTVVQGGLMTISLSGLNIRVTQGSGATMGSLRCSVIQIIA